MFGERIRSLRKDKGMTLRELSSELGIPFTTLGNYEREDRQPTPDILNAIADYFDVTVDYITGRTHERKETDHFLAEDVIDLEKRLMRYNPEIRSLTAEVYDKMYYIFFLGVDGTELEILKKTLDFIFRMKRGFLTSKFLNNNNFPSGPYEFATIYIKEKIQLDKDIYDLFEHYSKMQPGFFK